MKYILLIVTLTLFLDSITLKVFAKTNDFKIDSLEIIENNEDYKEGLQRFSRILVNNSFFDKMDMDNLNKVLKKDISEDFLFESKQLRVTKVYPNPAHLVAFMDYKMLESITAKITIRNLLGKVVRVYDLSQGNNKIRIPTMNFDAGVYFYTLSIKGKSVAGKKLIVKRQ